MKYKERVINIKKQPNPKKGPPKKPNDCRCNRPEIERQVNNPDNGTDQSETSLAYFQNFILYGFNNNAGSGFAFSNNLGQTWTDGGLIPPPQQGGVNAGDPTITVDKNGIFYYGSLGTAVIAGNTEGVINVSTGIINPNGTITMNPSQTVGRGQNPNSDIGSQDKPWITVGPDKSTPGAEALYAAWVDFTNPGGGTKIRFSKHRTGVNLTELIPSNTIISGTNEVFGPFIVVDKQGNIYVFYESRLPGTFRNINTQNRSIRMAKSTDGGNTFPIDIQVSAGLFEAAANSVAKCETLNNGIVNERPVISVNNQRVIRMFEIPQAAIGQDGTIYVVWNAGSTVGGVKNINVFLAYSQDGGNNWNRINITNNLSFSFFPSVTANCKGAHIQYNRFNDPNNTGNTGNGTFGIFMKSFSLNTGLSQERVISNPSSQVTINNVCYMGEYNQVISGPGSCLLHSWSDNRNIINGQPNADVFFRLTSS
ncbi:sialidase family protein [Priestia aryabhattai]|uniref:sialidase family protein n=1 Tax=Priestia aryabhattai TaxID=412384 RepID=UPI003B96A121